eukprot:2349290-Rhodomonas_salina.1
MTDPSSPISKDFPADFEVDMGGKNWEWEAVVLIPFIDEAALMEATAGVDQSSLTQQERHRNQLGDSVIFHHAPASPLANSPTSHTPGSVQQAAFPFPEFPADKPYFQPLLCPGVQLGPNSPPGFPTLYSLPMELGRLDAIGVDVFGRPSRRESMCLKVADGGAHPNVKPGASVGLTMSGDDA